MPTFPRPPVYNDKRIVVPLHSRKSNGREEVQLLARSVRANTDSISWSVILAESSSVQWDCPILQVNTASLLKAM
jgi:hypothetical protein